jgi:hypothetical protein
MDFQVSGIAMLAHGPPRGSRKVALNIGRVAMGGREVRARMKWRREKVEASVARCLRTPPDGA